MEMHACLLIFLFQSLFCTSRQVDITMGDAASNCNLNTQFAVAKDNGTITCHPCSKTPPGYRLKSYCYGYSDAEFKRCRTGKFNPGDSNNCRKCSKCGQGLVATRQCDAVNDTQCGECRVGTFANSNGICEQCRPCRLGHYVWKECNRTRNAICKRCPAGHYSSIFNAERCSPCGSCSVFTITVRPCKNRHDVQCGDCVKGYFKDPATNECRRCGFCYPNRTLVVDECVEKGSGQVDNQFVCIPVRPQDKGETAYGIYEESDTKNPDAFLKGEITILMMSALVCLITLAVCFTFILYVLTSCTSLQYILRRWRSPPETDFSRSTKIDLSSVETSHSNPSLALEPENECRNKVKECQLNIVDMTQAEWPRTTSTIVTAPDVRKYTHVEERSIPNVHLKRQHLSKPTLCTKIGNDNIPSNGSSTGRSLTCLKSANFELASRGYQSNQTGTDTDGTERSRSDSSASKTSRGTCSKRKKKRRGRKSNKENDILSYCMYTI